MEELTFSRAGLSLTQSIVNEILSEHNVDKQMSDSRSDVAYLMADISNVSGRNLQELHDNLEGVSGE